MECSRSVWKLAVLALVKPEVSKYSPSMFFTGFFLASWLIVHAAPSGGAPSAGEWMRTTLQAIQGKGKPAPGSASPFDVSACPKIPPSAWGSWLLLREPIVHSLRFSPGCDVQGTLRITMEPFPIDLALRNLPETRQVKGRVAVHLTPRILEQEADIDVDVTEGLARDGAGREILAFGSNYGATLGLNGRVKENRGGKVTARRFRGKPVHEVEPIRFH